MTDDRRGWHLEKSVSITAIIAIISCFISIVVWGNSLDKKAEINAQAISYVAEKQKDDYARLAESTKAINDKLDRLIEMRTAKQ